MQNDDPQIAPPHPPPIPVRPLSYQALQPPARGKSAGWKAFKIIAVTLLSMAGVFLLGAAILFGACMLLK
ncbi:MAG TPA: hypothetical protein VFE47_21700 [Tepidisphaeraceae bacterium]|jgi:hypothetical protein|nr:hypothetical protein [Tepidisphaeraceae bacterium]